jgi:ABC-type multidrug transport system ATPase subunit
MPQEIALYPSFTVRETLEFFAKSVCHLIVA